MSTTPQAVQAAEPVVTQQPAAEPQPQATPVSGEQTPEEKWFLEIDDRDRYRTVEDAKTGYLNLKNRVLELSPWSKAVERWSKKPEEGGFGLTEINPELVEQFFDELAQRRWQEEQAKGKQPTAAQPSGIEQLPAEWQQHIQYLTGKAGIATKSDVEAAVAKLEQSRSQSEQEAREKAIEEDARNIHSAAWKEMGLPDNERIMRSAFADISESVVNASRDRQGRLVRGSIEDRFINGDAATRQSIIKEQLKVWAESFDGFAKSKNASYATAKTAAQGSQPRQLPSSGAGAPASAKRLSETERAAALRSILEQQTGSV